MNTHPVRYSLITTVISATIPCQAAGPRTFTLKRAAVTAAWLLELR